MLQIEHVSYKVGKKKLIDDVSVNFEAGKLNLIIGPNGAGKTTLLKLICGQLQPQAGAIYYGGKDSSMFSALELARTRSVLSQNIELAFPLSVKEVVMMGRYPHFIGRPTISDERACEESMRFFDVWDMANRNYLTLSGGEKQRVHFARVVSQIWYSTKDKYRYLILDEPLTFLDVHYQFDFMHKLRELLLSEDIVIIGVIHDLNLTAKFADNIVLLHEGRLLASGCKQDVLTVENIKDAYQIEPTIHYQNDTMFLLF